MISGQCANCGFIYDVSHGFNCPACIEYQRCIQGAEHIKLNPRGIPGSFRVDSRGNIVPLSRTEMKDVRKAGWDEQVAEEETSEAPWNCKIPLGEQAQMYELRRLFRL